MTRGNDSMSGKPMTIGPPKVSGPPNMSGSSMFVGTEVYASAAPFAPLADAVRRIAYDPNGAVFVVMNDTRPKSMGVNRETRALSEC